MIEENSKKVHEFYEYINKIDLIDADYEVKIKTCAKKLVDDLHCLGRENVFKHVQANSLIFRENEVLCADEEIVIKKTMALEYFFLFAIDKYGMGSVLEKLLPQGIIHEKHSKLNPINWLLWIFNKIVWSEVKVRSEFSSDKLFVDAIQNIKKMSESADSFAREDLFNDKALHKAVNIIIERIETVARSKLTDKEEGNLIDLSSPSTTPVTKVLQPTVMETKKSSADDLESIEYKLPLPPPPSEYGQNFSVDDMPPPPDHVLYPLEDKTKTDPASSSEVPETIPSKADLPFLTDIQNGKKLKKSNPVPNEQNPQSESCDIWAGMSRKLSSMRNYIAPSYSNDRESGEWSESDEDPSLNRSSFFSIGNKAADSTNPPAFSSYRR